MVIQVCIRWVMKINEASDMCRGSLALDSLPTSHEDIISYIYCQFRFI